jgi:hypothetical protein
MKILILLACCASPLVAGSFQVSGSVVDSAGLPVRGAVIYLQGDSASQATISDPDGKYDFRGVPEGSYSEKASFASQVSSSGAIQVQGSNLAAPQIVLTKTLSLVPITLKVSPLNCKGPDTLTFDFNIDPDCASGDDSFHDAEIESALLQLKGGEYELIITKPNSTYVGTCLVLNNAGPDLPQGRVVHTSGMEITSDEYDQAFASIATLP